MRNLIVCCDGTWNTPDQEEHGVPTPTNVVRFYNAALGEEDGAGDQLKYYHPGVGADGNWLKHVAAGGLGLGLNKSIMSAYKWLSTTYKANDRICLLGFSRGAYTVRSLAGMIVSCGLLDLRDLEQDVVWARVEKAMEAYRKSKPSRMANTWRRHGRGRQKRVSIHFLGVWDTVGALGIPNIIPVLNLLDRFGDHEFHDTELSSQVRNARHAVAMDEKRLPFSPTFWTGLKGRKTAKQLWFPGTHADVGGGYAETGLSDIALKWMLDEAAALGMRFHEDAVKQVAPDYKGIIHDSYTGLYRLLRPRPRSVPLVDSSSTALHPSVVQRHKKPPLAQMPYRPSRVLKKGKSCTLSIYAAQPWNETAIYLEAGKKYKFSATGEWMDRNIKCGPGGADDGHFHLEELAHLVGAAIGAVEGLWKKLSGNQEADFIFSRREETIDWFCLVGAIANGRLVNHKMRSHETFEVGEGCEYEVKESGYLYMYANDSWDTYGNNRGSVTVNVEAL